jgi:hypothetical protein
VTCSRFIATTPESKFFKVAAPLSRFLVRHPKLSRFLAHVPVVSRFFTLPAVAYVEPLKPLYNMRARHRRRQPRFRI